MAKQNQQRSKSEKKPQKQTFGKEPAVQDPKPQSAPKTYEMGSKS